MATCELPPGESCCYGCSRECCGDLANKVIEATAKEREIAQLKDLLGRIDANQRGLAVFIAELKAENERLRAALERLVNACEREDWDANADNGSDPDLDAARAALASDNHH